MPCSVSLIMPAMRPVPMIAIFIVGILVILGYYGY